jgi:hypothetical protein
MKIPAIDIDQDIDFALLIAKKLFLIVLILGILMMVWAQMTLMMRTSFDVAPKAIKVNENAYLHDGVKIEMKWDATKEDWFAAYYALKEKKKIKSDTH